MSLACSLACISIVLVDAFMCFVSLRGPGLVCCLCMMSDLNTHTHTHKHTHTLTHTLEQNYTFTYIHTQTH